MKKLPIIDLLSLIVILFVGFEVWQLQGRVDRLELVNRGDGDALQSASLLPMSAVTPAGQRVTIGRGQPRLIFFMSTHCGYCAKNMPVWTQIAQKVGRDHTLFLLGNPEEMKEVPGYLAKYGLNGFPAAFADQDVIGRYYMKLVPRTLLVSSNGTVEKVWRGAVTSDSVLQGWNSINKNRGIL
jgi:thiol-disulfide isomerase/thioredoxin